MSVKNTTSAVLIPSFAREVHEEQNPNSQFLHSCSRIRGSITKFRLFVSKRVQSVFKACSKRVTVLKHVPDETPTSLLSVPQNEIQVEGFLFVTFSSSQTEFDRTGLPLSV